MIFDNITDGCYGTAIHEVLWMVNFKNKLIENESPSNRLLSMFRSWKRTQIELDQLDIGVIDIAVYCVSNRFNDCSGADCMVRVFEFIGNGGVNDIRRNSSSMGGVNDEGVNKSNNMD